MRFRGGDSLGASRGCHDSNFELISSDLICVKEGWWVRPQVSGTTRQKQGTDAFHGV